MNEPIEQPEHPKGALVVTLVYMCMIVAAWSFVYITLLSRGGTQ